MASQPLRVRLESHWKVFELRTDTTWLIFKNESGCSIENRLKEGQKAGTQHQFLGHGRVEIPVKHPSERTEQAFEYLGLVCREEICARDKIWESNTNTWYLKLSESE